jgi:steroid delta-isomerase-like uncharacterized protein
VTIDHNKDVVLRLLDEVFNRGNLAAVGGLMVPDYVLYDPTSPEPVRGPDGYAAFQNRFLTAFPDRRLTIEEQTAEGDRVVTRWRTRGTQRGDLPGLPATGRTVDVEGITISRLVDGRIAEDRQVWDALGFWRQLGALLADGPGIVPKTKES